MTKEIHAFFEAQRARQEIRAKLTAEQDAAFHAMREAALESLPLGRPVT